MPFLITYHLLCITVLAMSLIFFLITYHASLITE